MTVIKEMSISSIGEPAKVTIARNSKGYTWEVEMKAEDMETALDTVVSAERKLYSLYGDRRKDAGNDPDVGRTEPQC